MSQSLITTSEVRPDRARKVLGFLNRWFFAPVLTIFVASFVVFSALSLTPGDPVAQMLGGKSTPEQRADLTQKLGLDKNVFERYFDWLTGVFRGDWGTSYAYGDSVSSVLMPRMDVTASLVTYAALLILVGGVLLGLFGGLSNRMKPVFAGSIALMISIPSYVAATLLLAVFSVNLGWFPSFGAGDPGPDRIWHLTLPAFALSVAWSAYMAQITMAAVGDQQKREYVQTAIGRGLPRSLIVRKHILRNAGVPIITASGLAVAALVAGSVLVESAFTIDGIGSLLVRSVSSKDVPVVAAVSLIIIAGFVAVMTIVDILQTLIDPALRKGESSK